jgi:hypothetical protein
MKCAAWTVAISFAIAFLGSPVHSQDQNGAITGQVRGDGSRYALPGVKVTINGPGVDTVTITGSDGAFEVRGPFQSASYDVRLELPGFATIQRSVTAVPMGVASVSADMRVCDTGDFDYVDIGLPAMLQHADAVVHLRITGLDGPRPAQEAGEGVCGGREVEVRVTTLATAKLAAGMETPLRFMVRSGRTKLQPGEEFLAFLFWHPGIRQYEPHGYMLPVVKGKVQWRGEDRSMLRDGLAIDDAVAAVRRRARR